MIPPSASLSPSRCAAPRTRQDQAVHGSSRSWHRLVDEHTCRELQQLEVRLTAASLSSHVMLRFHECWASSCLWPLLTICNLTVAHGCCLRSAYCPAARCALRPQLAVGTIDQKDLRV